MFCYMTIVAYVSLKMKRKSTKLSIDIIQQRISIVVTEQHGLDDKTGSKWPEMGGSVFWELRATCNCQSGS